MNINCNSDNRRVGILTFPNSTSHGAVLQMYALYNTIAEMNYCPEVIYYHNNYMRKLEHVSEQQKGALRSAFRMITRRLVHGKMYRGFRRFELTMTHNPTKPFSDCERLFSLGAGYQSVICGSDQVWNPKITDYDISYFLNFCSSETDRIAYAPSFGFTNFSSDYDAAIAHELSAFTAVSVRERQGQEKIKELIGYVPELVLDPTFLIPPTQWESLETRCKVPNQYILYYSLRHADDTMRFCMEFAKKKQIPVVVVGGNMFSNLKAGANVQYMYDTDPTQWLYLIHHASYVVTNSFHGLAFSIIYRKNFFLSLTSLTNERLENLVSLFGLEKQIIRDGTESNDTDYAAAETVLPVMREQSLNFLKRALNHE